MSQPYAIIITTAKPKEPVTIAQAMLHASAERSITRSVATFVLVAAQVSTTLVMAVAGVPAYAILMGVLSGGLSIAALNGLSAWSSRKDLIGRSLL